MKLSTWELYIVVINIKRKIKNSSLALYLYVLLFSFTMLIMREKNILTTGDVFYNNIYLMMRWM